MATAAMGLSAPPLSSCSCYYTTRISTNVRFHTMTRPLKAATAMKKKNSSVLDLGLLTSQFRGIQLQPMILQPVPPRGPLTRTIQPIARRICPFTGKKPNKANQVTFSNHKTIKRQFVNLQYKRVWWEAGKRYVKLRLSTKALKTIEKYGLDAVAKKAGIDLRKK